MVKILLTVLVFSTLSCGSAFAQNDNSEFIQFVITNMDSREKSLEIDHYVRSQPGVETILPSLPTAFSSNDTTIVVDQTLELWTSGGVTYQWSPDDFLDCSDCNTVLCTLGESITCCIEMYDSIGNDGVNDCFSIRGELAGFNLRVTDKWENMVFEYFDIQTGWDGTYKGKEQNTGAFLYVMEAQLRNGQEIN